MPIIDSHCHVSDRWGEPVERLLAQMDASGVAQAVLVQLLGQYDNGYQQACLQRFPGVFASVVGIDVQSADAADALRRCADEGATGLRLRPAARSPCDDGLAIWRLAQQLGLTVSCVGNPAGFSDPAFAALVEALPGLPIVLEHLGGTSTADADAAARAARTQVFGLARYANVHLKLSGLGELLPRAADWPTRALPFDLGDAMPAVVDAALQAFGAQRLLWGSDFPVVAAREGYALALRGARHALAQLPLADQTAVFGGNAQRLFRMPGLQSAR